METNAPTMRRFLRAAGVIVFICIALLVWANWPHSQLPDDVRIDRVVVFKQERLMKLMQDRQIVREYRISLGACPVGHKQQEGDEKTPEGVYTLDWRNSESSFHRSYHISYPNEADRQSALAAGRDPGENIMIHGIRNYLGWIGRLHRLIDWTDGCIAITNPEMNEFWRVVPVGITIEVNP